MRNILCFVCVAIVTVLVVAATVFCVVFFTSFNTKVNGGWSTYSNWTECSHMCGVGTRQRTRTCTDPSPANEGTHCVGHTTDFEVCNRHGCPVDGGWTSFSNWTDCTVSCGGGIQSRERKCTNPSPANDGLDCIGPATNTSACNTHACPVDGGWSDFSSWMDCTVSCGGGTQTRTRTCTNPVPAYGGNNCTGLDSASKQCNEHNCPINGGWTAYSSWQACSASCGGGTQSKQRTCTNPSPAYGGAGCKGPAVETVPCNTYGCPVDGGWSYKDWGSCSASCNGGWQNRNKWCDNPHPANGGLNCRGSSTEQRRCNTYRCQNSAGTVKSNAPVLWIGVVVVTILAAIA